MLLPVRLRRQGRVVPVQVSIAALDGPGVDLGVGDMQVGRAVDRIEIGLELEARAGGDRRYQRDNDPRGRERIASPVHGDQTE